MLFYRQLHMRSAESRRRATFIFPFPGRLFSQLRVNGVGFGPQRGPREAKVKLGPTVCWPGVR